jgi:tRNA1Val (adenine37-N6)-methyltransferase
MGIFRFKRFHVDDTGCAMKTGTDAILLGAWTPLPPKGKVLDVGCGSGIISMMIAQRNPLLEITAVEIESVAAETALRNVKNLPFKHHIEVIKNDIHVFTKQSTERYDLLISNPPYFSNFLKGYDEFRNLARHDIGFYYAHLPHIASLLLKPDGILVLILPVDGLDPFLKEAEKHHFVVNKKLYVCHKSVMPPMRILLTCSKSDCHKITCHEDQIAIRNSDDTYSSDYLELTRDFYLFA